MTATATDWTGLPELEPGRIAYALVYARQLLTELGVDCARPETEASPERMVKALLELTRGLHTDPADHLATTFPPPSPDPGIIVVRGIRFASLCEHHLLPFTGTAAVAYLPSPGARIAGLSKFARLVHGYAARPQVQERLGDQVVEAIGGRLDVDGAACLIRSTHTCMTLRGACADGAEMATSHLRGRFRDDQAVRAELMTLLTA